MRVNHYILKRRTIGCATRNPYRPRGQVKYGPWVTVSSHMTVEEAVAAQRMSYPGLYDRGVFYKGIRVTRGHGQFTMAYVYHMAKARGCNCGRGGHTDMLHAVGCPLRTHAQEETQL